MKIGYIRVSSKDQNIDRQFKKFKDIGINPDNIYIDKITGSNANRPQLKKMLEFIRKGDTLYFVSIARLARNTKDFLTLMENFHSKEVNVVSLKEPIDTTTPHGKMMATVFASMYELERENIRQNQRDGIECAKERGVKFGRPKIEINAGFISTYKRWKKGEITATDAIGITGMSSSTFYRRVREYEESNN